MLDVELTLLVDVTDEDAVSEAVPVCSKRAEQADEIHSNTSAVSSSSADSFRPCA